MTKKQRPGKIVITGGPSAGKTTLTEILRREFRSIIEVVPESASILFSGGLPRGEDSRDKVFQQKVIYGLQVEMEKYFSENVKRRFLVCDRGTLDGLAYWPGSKPSFWKALKTTETKEIQRYDWVIHLDTAASGHYATSQVRREVWEEAQRINQLIIKAWSKHPQRIIIPNSQDFSKKLQEAIQILKLIQQGQSCSKICTSMQEARQ